MCGIACREADKECNPFRVKCIPVSPSQGSAPRATLGSVIASLQDEAARKMSKLQAPKGTPRGSQVLSVPQRSSFEGKRKPASLGDGVCLRCHPPPGCANGEDRHGDHEANRLLRDADRGYRRPFTIPERI